MSQKAHDRTAFATTSALFLMAVVGAALLVLGALLRSDARRTLDESSDAQLRQLVHAGAVDAMMKLNSGGDVPNSWDLALPAQFNGEVHIEVEGRQATITASVSDRRMVETVEIEKRR